MEIEKKIEREFRRVCLFGEVYQVLKPRRFDVIENVFERNLLKIRLRLEQQQKGYILGFPSSVLVYPSNMWENEWESFGKRYYSLRGLQDYLKTPKDFWTIVDSDVAGLLSDSLTLGRVGGTG